MFIKKKLHNTYLENPNNKFPPIKIKIKIYLQFLFIIKILNFIFKKQSSTACPMIHV